MAKSSVIDGFERPDLATAAFAASGSNLGASSAGSAPTKPDGTIPAAAFEPEPATCISAS